jgi:hypothetical protein
MNKNQLAETIREILANFITLTGIMVKKLLFPKANAFQKEAADATIEWQISKQKEIVLLHVKNEIRQWHVPELITQFGKNKQQQLLLCTYIPKPLKALLKENGINYIEASGNCFIKTEKLFIFINDKAVTPHRQTTTGKLWKNAGLRLVFAILQDAELLNKPYRTIAQQAHIALGAIGDLLQELKEEGYIKTRKEQQKQLLYIERPQELQKKWIDLFVTVLRPKLLQGRFRFLTPADKQRWQQPTLPNTVWGGEPAGAILTNYLEPQRFTLYTTQPKTEIIKTWRLLPDKNGELEILEPFWNITTGVDNKTVPPLMAYAELATSLDGRNRETAERIKQQYFENN